MIFRIAAFISALFLSTTFCALSAFGQTSVSSTTSPGAMSGTMHFGAPPPFLARAVAGAPYSGEEVTEQTQTLADGTHITHQGAVQKVYRDSLGRTRTERPIFGGMALSGRVPQSPVLVEITDPVAQVKYTLDAANKVAHRQQFQSMPNSPGRAGISTRVLKGVTTITGPAVSAGVLAAELPPPPIPPPPPPPLLLNAQIAGEARPQMNVEKLGTQTVEGVLAEGTRHTTVWPVGSQGNDRPISVVNETWMSTNLQVMVLSRQSDPRSGEHTQKLTNISQGEPAADLFQPPPDYSVVDETEDFTITWNSQK